jgi:hypothetical protein
MEGLLHGWYNGRLDAWGGTMEGLMHGWYNGRFNAWVEQRFDAWGGTKPLVPGAKQKADHDECNEYGELHGKMMEELG